MKKSIILIIALGLLSLTLAGCHYVGVRGNGHVVKKEINIGEFSKLEISGIFSAKVFVGGEAKLKLIAEKNLIKYIKIRRKGKRLIIYSTRNLSPRRKLLVLIKTPTLESIESSGVTRVFAKGIQAERFDVEVSGASEVKIIGRGVKLNADVSGASYLNAQHFVADVVEADCSGASKALVNAKGKLIADASGASSILFVGEPKVVKTDVSGISKIKRLK